MPARLRAKSSWGGLRATRRGAAPYWDDAPIRGELFSAERLETHARSLAAAHALRRRGKGRPLARRLAENEALLISAYRDTMAAIDGGATITPAAEWLADNFHLVERQIREIRRDLPSGYYRQLPKIASGHLAGCPRVFGIAWAFVAHTDSRFECEQLCRFLRAYQEVQPLSIGELWAVPITLRVVLIENLRRIAEQDVNSRAARSDADACCDRLLGAGGRAREPAARVLGGRDSASMPDAFVVQLCQRLRDDDVAMSPVLTWLDEQLARRGATVDAINRDEQQRQVSASVTARGVVTSMRLISDVDWSEIFERMSLVDEVLRSGSAFADMDFSTRNLYRNAIEELARGSGLSELAVARRVIETVRHVDDLTGEGRRCDPGHHLLGGGRHDFERALGFRPSPSRWPGRMIQALGIGGYVGASVAVAALLLGAVAFALSSAGVDAPWLLLLVVLGAIPAIDAAVAIVNRGVTRGLRATPLPALELKGGVPSRLRTLIAAPVLLNDLEGVAEQIERLEIHYLSSPQGHVHFAILSDWTDAQSASVENDAALLDAAIEGVASLNRKYGPAPGGDRFLLLHRRRVWSQGEACWMGWERKRGKLHELNRLLRGARDTTFISLDERGVVVPQGVRYVITLDADTRLPHDTVRRLIGKMAHPLNQAHFDSETGRVVDGYGILQPRITPAFPIGGEGSLFQRVFSSMGGIDPYASAISDVYQDLFGEGSYAGKGIYDIDAVEAALTDRIPEGALLSHDLFEGVFARAGLASDVTVVEEFPDRYDVSALRHHRWARGDWQLLPWILGLPPSSARSHGRARTPVIGRWKMLDNLRRSLSPIANLASLSAAWFLPSAACAIWIEFVLATTLVPPLIPVFASLFSPRAGVRIRTRLHNLAGDLRLGLVQASLVIIVLPHQAWLMADAIARTLWRLLVTRRRLLQWTPAAQVAAGLRLSLAAFYRRMAVAPALAGLSLAAAWLGGRGTWVLAVPFAILWAVAPWVAYRASLRPAPRGRLAPSGMDALALRLIARRTWRFFETFVTPTDHHLPPDNFQEDPAAVAHRTSPTNMGLYLLSIVCARDFGWIGTRQAVERLEATLATMNGLSRHRGHFYNWYDTRDLRPLEPHYVSSVDSGNLAGHLLALANSLTTWANELPSAAERLGGVADAVQIARQSLMAVRDPGVAQTIPWRRVDDALDRLTQALAAPWREDAEFAGRLERLAAQAQSAVYAAQALVAERDEAGVEDLVFWSEAILGAVVGHRDDLEAFSQLRARIAMLETIARDMALNMEFGFLIDPDRMLLSIGYRTAEGDLDQSCYDLLGSEARLASFVAIAKGDAPPRHWFRLGHAVTPVGAGAALISWSGSMFEYLMPSLVMRAPAGTLLAQTNTLVVRRQIDYARKLGVPWGMSESAYNARDLEFTYQYLSFGVPTLGLKRGLADQIVVAPYATALAAMIDGQAAVRNFEALSAVGACGRYGYYEAIDYTPSRVPEGQRLAIVRAFMAHHQGMSIVAIANAVHDGAMRERFHAEPMIQAAELLLEERMPRDIAASKPWTAHKMSTSKVQEVETPGTRRISTPHSPTPAVHLLSNGDYSVMVTAAGSGYGRWRDLAITRWREDLTRDAHGTYFYLRDVRSGAVWSAGHQPTCVDADSYEAAFSEDRCEIVRRDGALTTTLEILLSAEDDAEVRRVSISNTGFSAREIEVTSYAELVLAPQAADVAHPAFSKLFVETEHLPSPGAIIAHRRPRAHDEPEVWAAHLAVVEGEALGRPEFETDRAQFIGRGRDLRAPIRVVEGRPLAGTTGTVLDPIFALRRRVRIEPGGVARVSFWTMAASSRKALLDLIDKHHDPAAFDRAAALSWTQALVQLHHLGIDRGEAALYQTLASYVVHASPALQPALGTLDPDCEGQPGLWRVGVSGDLPIVLLRIEDVQDLGIARQLVQAAEFWRSKHLAFDLVLLNERTASYVQDLQIGLEALVRAGQSRAPLGERSPPGRTVVLRADLIPAETRKLLGSVARVALTAQAGRLQEQLERASDTAAPARPAPPRTTPSGAQLVSEPPETLEFFNGLGGFAKDGQEYVTVLGPGQSTPAPWINVVANPTFGFLASAEGAGCTWRLNSREHQLTPWSNDPVINPAGEAFYLRDEESGELWCPTASPIRDDASTYVARHGRGYCRFEHTSHGVELDLLQFVPLSDPVKLSRLRIRDVSGRPRRLSLTAYAEWVLGSSKGLAAPFTATRVDAATGALFTRNPWNPAFGRSVAFADLGGRQTSWTADRREFIGRNGSLGHPAALAGGAPLSNRVGAGFDPCSALQTTIELPANGSLDIIFLLGEADSEDEARSLVERYRSADPNTVLAEVGRRWDGLLNAVQVSTPDRSMDLMLNGWLLYQSLACRIWARSGFYQASGAFGFRDQLQDGMALAAIEPALAREHLLRAAGRQFVEGDVQHWWLPHSGQGVRTRISDDRVWLAYVTAHYVETTGDAAVLDDTAPFLEGRTLETNEAESFFQPTISTKAASLYEHCALALTQSLDFGGHGLPLIGGGDWNDGMNRVGERGLGESVWLGWLLHATLTAFVPLAEARGDRARAAHWRKHTEALGASLERSAWDGGWYRRAWFDDGAPLGSIACDECRIDSIAQSWAVLSGAAAQDRATQAMDAVDRELILKEDKLALLFTPPFDKTLRDPGYIKGYPPGIRENGGQYTHAAAWAVMAFARLGQGDRATELFAMINPVNRTRDRAELHRYKVEPYVIAADVYNAAGHVGRGGWTWYTGSAGWMQRAGVESILGLRRQGGFVVVDPCIPRDWRGFEAVIRLGDSRYVIAVENADGAGRGVQSARLDGREIAERPLRIELVQDGRDHRLDVRLGAPPTLAGQRRKGSQSRGVS